LSQNDAQRITALFQRARFAGVDPADGTPSKARLFDRDAAGQKSEREAKFGSFWPAASGRWKPAQGAAGADRKSFAKLKTMAAVSETIVREYFELPVF